MKKLLFCLWLGVLPVAAVPTPESAQALVRKMVAWGLEPTRTKDLFGPVLTPVVLKHRQDFTPEYYELIKWTSVPHPDGQGQTAWLWEMDPIWMVQASAIKNVKIGTPRGQGQTVLVPLDYVSPSGISATRPATAYHNVWVVSEVDGKPALQDVRYHPNHTKEPVSVLDELRKAKADYDKRMQK